MKEVTERQRIVDEKSKSEINSLRGQIRMYPYYYLDSKEGLSTKASRKCEQKWPRTNPNKVQKPCPCPSYKSSTTRSKP